MPLLVAISIVSLAMSQRAKESPALEAMGDR
jgi:hypothetical protein